MPAVSGRQLCTVGALSYRSGNVNPLPAVITPHQPRSREAHGQLMVPRSVPEFWHELMGDAFLLLLHGVTDALVEADLAARQELPESHRLP